MNKEIKPIFLTLAVVLAVFAINLSVQVTSAKAKDFVDNYINQRDDILENSYVDARDSLMICRHNPKLPSCPISKVLPKPKPSIH